MTKVLLTGKSHFESRAHIDRGLISLSSGGSGFIAAHILEQLLAKGHSVVTTVRSEEKVAPIRAAYPDKTQDELNVVIVPDIAKPNAFNEVVKIPGIEVVLHTASPFHFKFSM
jgi:nucleoside-diphosphate-sugar epimerase